MKKLFVLLGAGLWLMMAFGANALASDVDDPSPLPRENREPCVLLPDGLFDNGDGTYTFRQTTDASDVPPLYEGPFNIPSECNNGWAGFDIYSWYNQDYGWRHYWSGYNIPNVGILSMQVTICAWDVDYLSCVPGDCELDNIYVDGVQQTPTFLTGYNQEWHQTVFDVGAVHVLDDGYLNMWINIDATHSECWWATTLSWSQMSVTYTTCEPPYTPEGYINDCVDEGTDMCATVTGPNPPDPDGATVTYEYRWFVANDETGWGYVDDELNPHHPVNHDGSCVPASDSDLGDLWRVQVFAVDEDGCRSTQAWVADFPAIIEECCWHCPLVVDPCIIPVGCYRTQTQGGWGQDNCRGQNVACLRNLWFGVVFPAGLVVGFDNTLTLTSAAAVAAFLPQGKSPGVLDMDYVDPVNLDNRPAATPAGVFAGQVVSLAISIGFGDHGVPGFADLGPLLIASGPFMGWTVDEIMDLANHVLGGDLSGLPGGVTVSGLNHAITSINENFVDGNYSGGYLVECGCELAAKKPGWSSGERLGDSDETRTLQNYPNPFNPTTEIAFELKEAGLAKLTVFNILGEEVATLVNSHLSAGRHLATFNGASLPSGLYVYRLEANGISRQQKMLLMK